jgi:hypothetical protein
MNRASEGAAGGWTIGRVDPRIGWILGFAAILIFYLATTPENRTESGDGYAYAYDTEARSLTDLYDTRSLLFHVVMRLLYRAAHAIYDGVTGHAVLLTVSALSASAGLVLFGRLLNRHFGVSLPASLLGAGFLGASYGFWRYSVEAEVYAPSLFLIMAVLSLVFGAEDRAEVTREWTVLAPAGGLAGLAVLFYQANAIPLFLALPVLLLHRGGFLRLVAYGAAGAGVVLLGYVVAFLVDEGRPITVGALYTFVFDRFSEFELDQGLLAAIVKSIVTLGHVVVSGNWVFGLNDVASAVNEAVELREYDRMVFAASRAGSVFVYLPLFTLAALVAIGVSTICIAVRAHRYPSLDRRLAFALTWFGLYAFANGRLAPQMPEVWILTLPPITILFVLLVIEPCILAGRRTMPTILLATLVVHNAIGGIGVIHGADGDYYRAKGEWLLNNATEDDLVVLPATGGFRDFLCYVGGLRAVATIDAQSCLRHERRNVLQLIEATRERGGQIFVFDEFFEPPAFMNAEMPERYREALALAVRFGGTRQPVYRSDVGTTYRLP